jgi:hypothetical protein
MKKVVVQPRDFSDFVDRLQASGRYTFQREEARSALGVSEIALQSAARRLAAKGRICAPRRGFYVIVPVEYSQAGAPPPSWFIDDLMKFHQHRTTWASCPPPRYMARRISSRKYSRSSPTSLFARSPLDAAESDSF